MLPQRVNFCECHSPLSLPVKKILRLVPLLLSLFVLPARGQGALPVNPGLVYAAQIRHLSVARAWQNTPAGEEPARAYLQALRAWYRSDLPPEVLTGAAAEDFFAAHQALLSQRARPRRQFAPDLAVAHDSSSAHLRQLIALTQMAGRLPLVIRQTLLQRVAAREQALWRVAQQQERVAQAQEAARMGP